MYPMSCHLQQQRDNISLQLHDFAALLLQFPAATLLMPMSSVRCQFQDRQPAKACQGQPLN